MTKNHDATRKTIKMRRAVRCLRVPRGIFIGSMYCQVSFVNEFCICRALLSLSVLQCVAVCCSVLQCIAVCCSVLQCVAVFCSVLQYDAVCCSMLQCVAVCCSVIMDCEVCFENEPLLCMALLQKRPVNVGSLLIRKKALYISQKEPCAFATEPCISAKEAYN